MDIANIMRKIIDIGSMIIVQEGCHFRKVELSCKEKDTSCYKGYHFGLYEVFTTKTQHLYGDMHSIYFILGAKEIGAFYPTKCPSETDLICIKEIAIVETIMEMLRIANILSIPIGNNILNAETPAGKFTRDYAEAILHRMKLDTLEDIRKTIFETLDKSDKIITDNYFDYYYQYQNVLTTWTQLIDLSPATERKVDDVLLYLTNKNDLIRGWDYKPDGLG